MLFSSCTKAMGLSARQRLFSLPQIGFCNRPWALKLRNVKKKIGNRSVVVWSITQPNRSCVQEAGMPLVCSLPAFHSPLGQVYLIPFTDKNIYLMSKAAGVDYLINSSRTHVRKNKTWTELKRTGGLPLRVTSRDWNKNRPKVDAGVTAKLE